VNKKDIQAFDNMICNAWNDNNAFCRKMKQYILDHFQHVPELQERCKDPYWKDKRFLTDEQDNSYYV